FSNASGQLGFMSPFVWMFISSYENLRTHFIDQTTISSLIQLEYSGFDGATVPICTFTLAKTHLTNFIGSYIRLSDFKGSESQAPKTLEAIQNPNCGWLFNAKPDDFKKIPGSPIAYWIESWTYRIFATCNKLKDKAVKGLDTGGSIDSFLRLWYEVDIKKSSLCKGEKWFPLAKGGEYRKWYGNNYYLINYENDGEMLKNNKANLRNKDKYFKEGLTWTVVTSGGFSVRYLPSGFLFDQGGSAIFSTDENLDWRVLSASLNSSLGRKIAKDLCPTLNFTTGDVNKFPVLQVEGVEGNSLKATELSRINWDSYETSWDFTQNPIVRTNQSNLQQAFNTWQQQNSNAVAEMKRLEEENNKLFIEAYGLQDELTPDVPDEQITLTRADREKDTQRLVSYALGCMMGRYSLDEPGLIYAHAGNQNFDASRYQKLDRKSTRLNSSHVKISYA